MMIKLEKISSVFLVWFRDVIPIIIGTNQFSTVNRVSLFFALCWLLSINSIIHGHLYNEKRTICMVNVVFESIVWTYINLGILASDIDGHWVFH